MTTELEEEVTEASNTDDKHGDVLHAEDITSNVWADPDVEVFTTENVNTQTDSDMTTQDDQIVEVTTDIPTDFVTTTENDQITTDVPGGLEVAPVVVEFVTEVEEGVWNDPDGLIGEDQQDNLLPVIDIQPVVAEEESTTIKVEVAPATAASVVEEVEGDAWTDPHDQNNGLLPEIQPVLAETTTSESFTADDSTTEFEAFSTNTILPDGSTQVTTEENEETTTEGKEDLKTLGLESTNETTTTEVPVHLFDDDIDDQTPLETIIDFLTETTADSSTTNDDTGNTESSTEAMESSTTTLAAETESTTGNSDPTLDYDMQQQGVTEQIETTLVDAEAFDDDLDNFDKISVVTSMSLSDEGNNVEEETDEVTVVTASPAQPVPDLDDLDLIDSSIQDVFTTGVEVTTESMSTTRGDVESTETVTDTSLSTLELLQDFDFLGGDNGFIHNAFVTTGATTLQDELVYNADTTEPNKELVSESVSTMGDSLETTTESIGVNSEASAEEMGTTESASDVTTIETGVDTSTLKNSQVIFRDDELVDTSTYFPVTGGEIQDDDVYEDLTDPEVAALVSDVIFDETTTGSPNNLFALEAVEADTEVIFDETTTPGSAQEEVVPINFGEIEAVEADYNEDVEDSNQVFDETTTGAPLLVVQPVLSEEESDGSFVENIENEVWSDPENPKNNNGLLPEIDAVVAETTESEEGKIFDETTTGSPWASNLPVIQPVVAETEQEFSETTTGSYAENQQVQDDDLQDTTTAAAVGSTRSNAEDSRTEETPAFTTAASKNTTTVPLDSLEEDEKVIFPEVQDDMLEVLKDMLLEDFEVGTTVPSEEVTTVRVEVGENILETTSRKILSASELNRDEIMYDEETTRMPQNVVKESEIVQLEAEGVNGPLNLNEAVYYDDTDDTYVDVDSNFVTTEAGEETMDTTTAPMTTVVNGFIVNKNPVLETLDNNGIETVRTGGDIKVEITTNAAEETTTKVAEETTTKMGEEKTTITATMAEEGEDVTEISLDSTTLEENMEEATTLKPETIFTNAQDETTVVNDVTADTTQEELESSTILVDNLIADDTQQKQNESEVVEKRPASKYPITDLLNSIYRLVTGIRESSAAEAKAAAKSVEPSGGLNSLEIQYFDSPLAKPLNVHNSPREPLPFTTSTLRPGFRESVDLANSNTDPFQQLSAPDLTGFIPEGEKEENVQYIFASPARNKEPARTLSPFNSDALRVEEPPKVLVPELAKESEGGEEEPGSFSLSSLLPSFFSSPVESVQVAGSLPVTVRDPAQQNIRRPDPPSSSNQGGGLLSSLFSRPASRRPSQRPRPRPIRPDVPAQQVGFQIPARFSIVPIQPRCPRGGLSQWWRAGNVASRSRSLSPCKGRRRRKPRATSLLRSLELSQERTPVACSGWSASQNSKCDKLLLRFIDTAPWPMRNALLNEGRVKREVEEEVNCTWTIQVEKAKLMKNTKSL